MTVGDVVDVDRLVAWLHRFAELVEQEADALTALDAAIGDADHGTNMRRGCRAIVEALAANPPADVATFGRSVAMTLISAVGGASGPLYGSFFLTFGTTAGATDALGADQVGEVWTAAVGAIASRGKAEVGDKTMLDALVPAADALREALADGRGLDESFAAALSACAAGRDATIPLVARKGRASYLGERSAGHQDPGATSSTLLVQAAAETVTTS